MSVQNKKVYILNYGINNIRSLFSAFLKIGAKPIIINKWTDIKDSYHLVLPGVGAFSTGIDNLKSLGYYDEILNHSLKNKPLLGICLGMQMLFEQSEEFGLYNGIGLIKGKVKKLPSDTPMKLPNVGWYSLNFAKEIANTTEIDKNVKFYFNHGYFCAPTEKNIVLSYSSYGNFKFCSSFKDENIMGTQFHPEKSGVNGLNFLKIFINN
tara:strand:- start:18008 stop:18634 length:627 start_codon:yes stop_codon:yes gene_type:complete